MQPASFSTGMYCQAEEEILKPPMKWHGIMNIYKNSDNFEPNSTHSLSAQPPSMAHRLNKFSKIALSSIGLTLLTISNSFAVVNGIPDPVKFEQNTTIRSFNETTSLAEELWATLTVRFVSLYEKGEYNTALSIAERTYDIAINNFGLNDVNTADTLLKLGRIEPTLGT